MAFWIIGSIAGAILVAILITKGISIIRKHAQQKQNYVIARSSPSAETLGKLITSRRINSSSVEGFRKPSLFTASAGSPGTSINLGRMNLRSSFPSTAHLLWLVRDERNGRKYPVFLDRSPRMVGGIEVAVSRPRPLKFADVPRDIHPGDRVRVTGRQANLWFYGDVALDVLGASDVPCVTASDHTECLVLLADTVEKQPAGFVVSPEEHRDSEEILRSVQGNQRGHLLLLGSQLEHLIKAQVNELYPESAELIDSMSVPQLYRFGSERGLFPETQNDAIFDFWRLRNSVAHPTTGFDVEDSEVATQVALGARLLSILQG